MNKYSDILYLEHPTSKKRKRMSLYNRSAQFAPFSALTGYEEEIKETGRITDTKKCLTEEVKEKINEQLQYLEKNKNQTIKITYFQKDTKKKGGTYYTITTKIKRIDSVTKELYTATSEKIQIDDIVKLEFLTYNNFI